MIFCPSTWDKATVAWTPKTKSPNKISSPLSCSLGYLVTKNIKYKNIQQKSQLMCLSSHLPVLHQSLALCFPTFIPWGYIPPTSLSSHCSALCHPAAVVCWTMNGLSLSMRPAQSKCWLPPLPLRGLEKKTFIRWPWGPIKVLDMNKQETIPKPTHYDMVVDWALDLLKYQEAGGNWDGVDGEERWGWHVPMGCGNIYLNYKSVSSSRFVLFVHYPFTFIF